MATRRLDRAEWREYFDGVSNQLGPAEVEIEIAALPLGVQVETKWATLRGLTYDPKSDVMQVFAEGVNHLIHGPQEIFVQEDDAGLESVSVLDKTETKQIITLRRPLQLGHIA